MNEQEKGLTKRGDAPLALLPNDERILVGRAEEVRKGFLEQKTDKSYVRFRQDYVYVTAGYLYDKFEQVIPLYKERLVHAKFNPTVLQVEVALEIMDLVTGLTHIGVGAARVQVTKEARARLEKGGALLPFDIVDYDKQFKAARTQAKKDCIKEFGVCADLYNRQIIPDDFIKKVIDQTTEIIEKHVTHPTERMKWKKEMNANIELTKTSNRRDQFFTTLQDLKTELNLIESEENTNEESESVD